MLHLQSVELFGEIKGEAEHSTILTSTGSYNLELR